MCTFSLLNFSINVINLENKLSYVLIFFIFYVAFHCLTCPLYKRDILFYVWNIFLRRVHIFLLYYSVHISLSFGFIYPEHSFGTTFNI